MGGRYSLFNMLVNNSNWIRQSYSPTFELLLVNCAKKFQDFGSECLKTEVT
jgi:hypothetical protein